MSYLDTPRFSFRGRFMASPPTLNNVLEYFTPGAPGFGTAPQSTWNVDGDCSFAFEACHVTSATYLNGNVETNPIREPLIQSSIDSNPRGPGVPEDATGLGKIVDLDPYQQRVTQLIAVTLTVELEAGVWVSGTMQPAQMRDFWKDRSATSAFLGDYAAGATWQSILTDLHWNGDINRSPVLTELQKVSGDRLSIKLNVDNYVFLPGHADFLKGRLIGTIGPSSEDEPQQFVAGRRLISAVDTDATEFWPVSCQLNSDETKVVFDLGHSVQLQTTGGASRYNQLFAAILPLPGDASPPVVLPPPLNCSKTQLERTAGIVTADLAPGQAAMLETQRLGLLTAADQTVPVLAEHETAKFADCDCYAVRLNPGESQTVELYATQFGQPLSGETFDFDLHPTFGPDGNLRGNVPRDVLFPTAAPLSVTTDTNGRATLTLTAKAGPIVGLPADRADIDSQVYYVGDPNGWQLWGMVGPHTPFIPDIKKWGLVSVVVYNTHALPGAAPTWADVQPILEHYATMFPGMTKRLDLSSEVDVTNAAAEVRRRLLLPESDGQHMPATRDLSAYRRDLLVAWLNTVAPVGP